MAGGILVTLLLESCLYVTYGLEKNIKHNVILGRKGDEDIMLYHTTITKSNWNPLGHTGVDVTYPTKNTLGAKPVITQIKAIDLQGYDRGGEVFILKGKLGGNNLTIRFISQKGRGLKFALTIYGHY